MANKKPEAAWDEAERLFKRGYDLVTIANRTTIAKGTIANKARDNGWEQDVSPKHGIQTSIADLEALIGDLAYFALMLPKDNLQEHRDLSVIIANHMTSREKMLNQAEALSILQILEGAQMAIEWIRKHYSFDAPTPPEECLEACYNAHREKLAKLGL